MPRFGYTREDEFNSDQNWGDVYRHYDRTGEFVDPFTATRPPVDKGQKTPQADSGGTEEGPSKDGG